MTAYIDSPTRPSSRIAIVSTYPPTECGIATFTRSLTTAILGEGGQAGVVRLLDRATSKSPDEVIHEHRSRRDLTATQEVLNSHDVAIIQHEFGIFGGHDGKDVISLMNPLTVPIIAVLHTVLAHPTAHQRHVLNQIIERANALITMTQSGKDKLIRGYGVDPSQVHVFAHGARPMSRTSHPAFRPELKERPRILTWGLIGPGKGLEWAIDALGELNEFEIRPEYLIAGQTHPHVKLQQGERYRKFLVDRIEQNNVQKDVRFIDRYLNDPELEMLIASADVIVLPYDSIEQVTSGVLVEAAVAGKPIIATHFPHATEMLGDGSGILVDQQNSSAIAQGLRDVLTSPTRANVMSEKLLRKSGNYLWPVIGRQYLNLTESLTTKGHLPNSEYVAS